MFDIVKYSGKLTSAVLELCDGSLTQLIKERKDAGFLGDEILEVITTVAKSLKYLHSKGIIHRDLKPDNILYQNLGGIKIWKINDFGTST